MRTRQTYNFSAETVDPAVKSAVDTVNMISMLDTKGIEDEEVKTISDATGASEGFVDQIADIVSEADESKETPEVVTHQFSNVTQEIINEYVSTNNFAAPGMDEPTTGEQKVADIAQIITMVDDDVMEHQPVEEIAETIADATCTPVEAVKELVENAKEQFSNGNEFQIPEEVLGNFANYLVEENFGRLGDFKDKVKAGAIKLWTTSSGAIKAAPGMIVDQVKNHGAKGKIVVLVPAAAMLAGAAYGTKKLIDRHSTNHSAPVVPTELIHPGPEPMLQPAVVPMSVPSVTTPVEQAQSPSQKALDTAPGTTPSDPKPAAVALKVQNDLATVAAASEVPGASTAFSQIHSGNQSKSTDGLQRLMGDRYIPVKK